MTAKKSKKSKSCPKKNSDADNFKPIPLPGKSEDGKKKPSGVDRYAEYLSTYYENYDSLNRSVEGGRKHKKKNRKNGNNWKTSQETFQKLKHGHPGTPRRGNN